MDDKKPRSPTVQQIIDDANSKAIAAEINRTFANIAGRPAPDPKPSSNRGRRAASRKDQADEAG